MKTLQDRVAVVTGASSGIGFACAKAFAKDGCKLVIASQNADRLRRAEDELASLGAEVLAVPTDVERRTDVERLAERTLDHYGAVHVLVNNAGVYAPGYAWEIRREDWEWVIGVNLWGPVYGIQAFTPHLLAQDEAHIVNVASAGGLMTAPCHSPYSASKHAIVGLSKSLRAEFAMKQVNVGVTLVCPGGVVTNISSQFETTGPGGKPRESVEMTPDVAAIFQAIDETVEKGIPSDEVGAMIRRAILENEFWVLPNAEVYYPVFDAELAEIKAGISN
ncbi:MAG: SDR family NAD(P)-dependent oxidoreductase [Deltaproteobacteria bacterium]|jgi:NAD(P)-dependent dehydrogenase (short-subunit alcohol dehydrogenase family)|nr:SDR family NAD(P)-dependent oxidoreductase [Deltaproteobacteria bacterium]